MREPAGPVFLGGCPRSGLTLLRSLLSTHPRLYCGSDTSLAPPIVLQWRNFSAALGALHARDFGLNAEHVRREMADLLLGLIDQGDGRVVCEKSPLNILVFADLAAMIPEARFVHVVRDGRDVAHSLLQRDWCDPRSGVPFAHVREPARALDYWSQLVDRGLQAETAVGRSRCLQIRYEDLVQRPKRTLKSLFGFIGLDLPGDLFAFHQRQIDLEGIERDSLPLLGQKLTSSRVMTAPDDLRALAASMPRVRNSLEVLGYSYPAFSMTHT